MFVFNSANYAHWSWIQEFDFVLPVRRLHAELFQGTSCLRAERSASLGTPAIQFAEATASGSIAVLTYHLDSTGSAMQFAHKPAPWWECASLPITFLQGISDSARQKAGREGWRRRSEAPSPFAGKPGRGHGPYRSEPALE